jgi:hypothetical protein
MRPILIVSGVLGGGSALVFAAAGVIATLFPHGTMVAASPWGGGMRVMPAIGAPVMVDDGTGGWQDGVEVGPDIVVPGNPSRVILR